MIFDTVLYRIDPSKNMSRFYSMTIQPDLFGGHSLLRNWGRIGSHGQMRIDSFDCELSAQDACQIILRLKTDRGYRLSRDNACQRKNNREQRSRIN
ncbi:WGR domain-containing protein [Labrenzia sp. DG1229]|uniref:WGR domain-containing protein n=1 Tax=Labrenzia sp. DG1229 TaxID=681847 RepID=UPI00336A9B03